MKNSQMKHLAEKPKKNWGKASSAVTTAVFLLLLFGIAAGSLIAPKKEFSDTENRPLQQLPKFSFSKLLEGEFTSDFESYVQDQFLWRDKWISAKNHCEIGALKKEINSVFIAEDGYFIEDHPKTSYTDEVAQNNILAVSRFAEKNYEKFGSEHMSVIIAPNAQTVLREKLPSCADPYDQNEFIGRMYEGLPQGVAVDVSETLSSHSDEYIYYRTDHHWTSGGAYLAYAQWAQCKGFTVNPYESYEKEILTDEFLGTVNSKLNLPMQADTIEVLRKGDGYEVLYDDNSSSEDFIDRTYLQSKDKYGAFFSGNSALVRLNTQNKNGKKLVVFKDSYANCFVPLLADEFESVYMVDLRYYNKSVSEFLEEINPTDVMILYNADSAATDMNLRKIAG